MDIAVADHAQSRTRCPADRSPPEVDGRGGVGEWCLVELVISKNNNAGVTMDIDSNHDLHTLPAHTYTAGYTQERNLPLKKTAINCQNITVLTFRCFRARYGQWALASSAGNIKKKKNFN